MEFKNFLPSDILKPYVKYYWILHTRIDLSNEILYPSGYVELAINISNGNVVTHIDNRSVKMPSVEILGQLTRPSKVSATHDAVLLIVRFYPHASSLFFPNRISNFTNDSIDLYDVFSRESTELYNRLMDCPSLEQKIAALDRFLVQKLIKSEKNPEALKLVELLCRHASNDGDFFNVEHLALRYGFSERYLQKLFLDCVGVTPKSFFSIQRFNRSLELIRSSDYPLTSIAHECGYYDQAHFIKEFKSYTGITPSQVARLQEVR